MAPGLGSCCLSGFHLASSLRSHPQGRGAGRRSLLSAAPAHSPPAFPEGAPAGSFLLGQGGPISQAPPAALSSLGICNLAFPSRSPPEVTQHRGHWEAWEHE